MKNLLTKCYIESKLSLEQFRENQQGVTAIEYGLIAVALAGVVGTALALLGPEIKAVFDKVIVALKAA